MPISLAQEASAAWEPPSVTPVPAYRSQCMTDVSPACSSARLASFAVGAPGALLVVLSEQHLRLPAAGFAWLIGAIGVGAAWPVHP